MKKLLSLLSVLTITGTTMSNVIAASNYEKNENKLKNSKRFKRFDKKQNRAYFHEKVQISNVIGITDLGSIPLFMVDSNTIDTRYYDNNVSIIIEQIRMRNTSLNLNNQNLIVDEINGSGARIRGTDFSQFLGFVNISFTARPIILSNFNFNLGEITNNDEETILSAFRNNNRNIITDPPNLLLTMIRIINFTNITNNSARININNPNNNELWLLINNMNLTVTFSLINDEAINYINLRSLINNTYLGILNDNNDQTILERFIRLNPNINLTTNELRVIRKSENFARIISTDRNVQGNVNVTFSIKKTLINKKSSYFDDSNGKKRRKSNINLNWVITGPMTNDEKIESKELNLIKWSDYANSIEEFKEKYKHIKFNDFDASAGGQGTTVSNKTNIEFNTESIDDLQIYEQENYASIVKYDFLNYVPMPFINYVEQSASLYIKNLFFEGEYIKAFIISYTYSWMAVYHVWTKLKIDSVEFY